MYYGKCTTCTRLGSNIFSTIKVCLFWLYTLVFKYLVFMFLDATSLNITNGAFTE